MSRRLCLIGYRMLLSRFAQVIAAFLARVGSSKPDCLSATLESTIHRITQQNLQFKDCRTNKFEVCLVDETFTKERLPPKDSRGSILSNIRFALNILKCSMLRHCGPELGSNSFSFGQAAETYLMNRPVEGFPGGKAIARVGSTRRVWN